MNHILSLRQLLRVVPVPRFSGHACSLNTSAAQRSGEGMPPHEDVKNEGASAQEEEEEPQADDFEGEDQLKKEILNAALPFVHSLGWSQDALAQGAESLGYSEMAHCMFPSGGVELVNHFYSSCNDRLKTLLEEEINMLKEQPELKKGTTAFIATAVEARLRMNIEYIDQWHKALALHASPTNIPKALENIGTVMDHIWFYAGDRSTDFNWYTKRGLLAAVYKSSEVFMLQDRSDDFEETWAFMNRRLSDIHSVGKCARSVGSFAGNFGSYSKAGLSTVLNILGMNSRYR